VAATSIPISPPRRRRPRRRRALALLGLGLLLFITISAILARWLSVENIERDDVLGVLQAQAAGNAPRALALLHGCAQAAPCARLVRAEATVLRRPGQVKILDLVSPTGYTLTGATGRTRVAWDVPGRLPVVQCVTVRRSGNIVTGISVTLLALSRPIPNTADC
jgi:hypothetical protein